MKKNIKLAFGLAVIFSTLFFVSIIEAAPKMNNRDKQDFSFFVGGGYKNFFPAKDTFTALYESADSMIFDAGMKLDLKSSFFISAEAYFLSKSGERVWVSSEGTAIKTGIAEDLTLIPISATLGYYIFENEDFQVYLGVGAGFYIVQLDCEVDSYDRNESGTGFFGTLGADFSLSDTVYLAIETKYELVTGLIGDTGVPAIFEEDDLGGIMILMKIGFKI